jgi:hypothetical protein
MAWTIDTLRKSLTQRIEAQDRLVHMQIEAVYDKIRSQEHNMSAQLEFVRSNTEAAFGASEKAILKAESAAERRFESVNEFRAALSDQTARLMPRNEVENMFKSVNEKIDEMRKQLDLGAGRRVGGAALWGYIVGGVGLLVSIAVLVRSAI